MKAKEKAEELLLKYSMFKESGNNDLVKEAAIILCDEMGRLLPNINETPPNSRLPRENYFQFWRFDVKEEISKLK